MENNLSIITAKEIPSDFEIHYKAFKKRPMNAIIKRFKTKNIFLRQTS